MRTGFAEARKACVLAEGVFTTDDMAIPLIAATAQAIAREETEHDHTDTTPSAVPIRTPASTSVG
jgi:hypothetical protein